MFLEKLFGNVFGFIWLIIFILTIFSLLVWVMFKKEKVAVCVEKQENEKKEYLKEDYKNYQIDQVEDNKFSVKKSNKTIKSFDNYNDCKVFIDVLSLREENVKMYEIVEIDNSFKVRKNGSDRTLRKFATLEEAENFVKEKENNDR